MNVLELLVRLVEAVAWPGTVLLIVCMFRRQFVGILPLLKRLKAGPVEAEFEQGVAEISNAQSWHLPAPDASAEATSRRQQLIGIAQINPRMAIIDAWQGIEFSLKKATLQRFGGNSPAPSVSSPVTMIRELAHEGCIDASDVSLLHELRGLRNQATHLPEYGPSFESVSSYIDLAVRVQEKLDELAQIST